MNVVVLWRHSRTEYNVEGRLQGSLDVDLGPAGQVQAAHAAAALRAEHPGPMRVVTSPLKRARRSAEALAELAGVDAEVDEAFTQRSYGEWEGLTWAEVEARWPEEYARRMRGEDPRIGGWGSSAEVAGRVGDGIERVWDPEATVVVVSHGGAIMLGLLHVLGLEPDSRALGHLPHAAWNVLRRHASGAWQLEAYGRGAD